MKALIPASSSLASSWQGLEGEAVDDILINWKAEDSWKNKRGEIKSMLFFVHFHAFELWHIHELAEIYIFNL